MAFCRKCGTKLNEGVKFCPKCGQMVDGVLVSQPQENQAQQEPVEKPEEKKSFTYRMWHNKWNWIAAIVLLIVVGAVKTCGGSTTEMLQNEVKKSMVEKMKEKGQTLKIIDFTLVHQDGNNYKGIAKCTLDGEKMDLDVNVIFDGSNFQAEWAPTAEYRQKVFEEGLQELFD